jgi:hypothetical protein
MSAAWRNGVKRQLSAVTASAAAGIRPAAAAWQQRNGWHGIGENGWRRINLHEMMKRNIKQTKQLAKLWRMAEISAKWPVRLLAAESTHFNGCWLAGVIKRNAAVEEIRRGLCKLA